MFRYNFKGKKNYSNILIRKFERWYNMQNKEVINFEFTNISEKMVIYCLSPPNIELINDITHLYEQNYYQTIRKVYDSNGNEISRKSNTHSSIEIITQMFYDINRKYPIHSLTSLKKRYDLYRKLLKKFESYEYQYNVVYYKEVATL